jgi:hypothetical protein
MIGLCGILGGGFSVAYSAYVVMVYLLKADVQAGWTTMSLQIALLTFFLSIMLAFLVEYVLHIYSASTVRRRFFVSREIRSQSSRRSARLNVFDGKAHFSLGAPQDKPNAAE